MFKPIPISWILEIVQLLLIKTHLDGKENYESTDCLALPVIDTEDSPVHILYSFRMCGDSYVPEFGASEGVSRVECLVLGLKARAEHVVARS